MSAVFSTDGVYRYALWRQWLLGKGTLMFVMLNPSTADAIKSDPTVTRCIGFAQTWGFQQLIVANAFAYRSTDPQKLRVAEDPIGPENDEWISKLAAECSEIVVAWGAHPAIRERETDVLQLLASHAPIRCLGVTAAGHPRHPLYIPAKCRRQPYAVDISEPEAAIDETAAQIPGMPDGWRLEILEPVDAERPSYRAVVRARNGKAAERKGVTAIAALDNAIASLNPYYLPTRAELAQFVLAQYNTLDLSGDRFGATRAVSQPTRAPARSTGAQLRQVK